MFQSTNSINIKKINSREKKGSLKRNKQSQKCTLLLLAFLFLFSLGANSESKAGVTYIRPEKGGGSAQTKFIVPFPYEFTLKILASDKFFIQIIPGMQKWEVIKNAPPKQIARCTMSMSKLIPPFKYIVEVNSISTNEIRFKRISGDLEGLEGIWRVDKGDKEGTSLITYQYKIKTGFNYFPRSIMDNEIRKHLRDTESRVNNKLKQIYKTLN